MTRTVVTGVALLFICAMAFATVYVLLTEGPDVLVVVSLAVVAVLGYGLGGALATPPEDR